MEIEKAIEKAKALVARNYGETGDRKWLKSNPPDSYGDERYRVELYVFEGSPPKGFVVADWSHLIVKAFNQYWTCLHTFKKVYAA
jgi:hypothetical protein